MGAAVDAAASQAWPAFALVTGLLLVGIVAERDGLFAAAGSHLARLPLGPRLLFVASLALVALVTAALNLDTAVFFLTPILLHLARRRRVETPFLYGAVFMSNAGSLSLPGSNLTNLIVLNHEHLLIGLDLGPKLAVTGSLSAVLWLRVARSHGARPSVRTYTLLGLLRSRAAHPWPAALAA